MCAPPPTHSTEPQAPDRLALALNLMESAVDAVEGRLKSPTKKQGVICRTLLKALLMECFAWLPPNTFPSSSARLFKVRWCLSSIRVYMWYYASSRGNHAYIRTYVRCSAKQTCGA